MIATIWLTLLAASLMFGIVKLTPPPDQPVKRIMDTKWLTRFCAAPLERRVRAHRVCKDQEYQLTGSIKNGN